ncbi:hypothetical protein JNK13_07310, partial [bacterium]|nr:hypothetical protein [bacterium]
MSEEIKGNTTSKLLDLTVLLGFIGALSLYVVQPISDGDLWWHIVSGRWILAQGSIPTSDQWNITGAGKLWRAYSWSNEIVYAWVHDHLGRDFLICLLISLSILFTCAVGSLLFRLAGSSFFAAFLTLFVVAGCTDHFALRPQTLTYVLFATVIYLADRLHCKRNNYNYLELLLITGIFSLWSNTHLTAVFGVIALLLWSWRLDALDLAQLKSSIRSRGLIVPLACALFGTFLTPYFGAEWSVLAHKTNHPFIYNEINEFKPANIMKYSVAALILLIVFMQVLILQDKQRVAMQPGRLLCTLFFILLGLSITKFMPYALIATVALLADCWKEQRQRSTGKLNQAFSLLEENCVKYLRYFPTKLLIIAIFLICISERLLILSKNAFDLRSYPVNASNFLLEKN